MSTNNRLVDWLKGAASRIGRLKDELYGSARERAREEVRDVRREQDAVLERDAEARHRAPD